MQRLTFQQKDVLQGLHTGRMQLARNSVRDELVAMGLVEMKLGGWGLTKKGQKRLLLG